jgi:LacI family transcriptional regulator
MRIFIAIDCARSYNRALVRGITRYAKNQGSWAFFYPPQFWEKAPSIELSKYLRGRLIDGIITTEPSPVDGILETGLPTVVSPSSVEYFDGLINITTDHPSVGKMAAQHLMDCGFRHFAFAGYHNQFWSQQRQHGFEKLLYQHGHSVSVYKSQVKDQDSHREVQIQWLKTLNKSTGIMASVDERGRELLEACLMAGISVPDDIGVIGVDNDGMICNLSIIPLSSIAIDAGNAGFAAARLLDLKLNGKTPAPTTQFATIKPTTVIGRQSTDLVFAVNPQLSKAISYIRAHISEPIQVNDVAQAAGISRRALEKLFQTHLKRTVHWEIKHNKIQLFQKLLIESDLKIDIIARQIGLESAEHAARYFSSWTTLSPTQYRNSNRH